MTDERFQVGRTAPKVSAGDSHGARHLAHVIAGTPRAHHEDLPHLERGHELETGRDRRRDPISCSDQHLKGRRDLGGRGFHASNRRSRNCCRPSATGPFLRAMSALYPALIIADAPRSESLRRALNVRPHFEGLFLVDMEGEALPGVDAVPLAFE